jgi:hypothetical protein
MFKHDTYKRAVSWEIHNDDQAGSKHVEDTEYQTNVNIFNSVY